MTREDLVKIARRALERHASEVPDVSPMTYDPPEWMIEAMSRVAASEYKRGYADGRPDRVTTQDGPT